MIRSMCEEMVGMGVKADQICDEEEGGGSILVGWPKLKGCVGVLGMF